jgi:hypothetical protein
MTRKRQRQLVARDSAAIVADTQALHAARSELDLDRACPGVEAVLDQLLQRR